MDNIKAMLLYRYGESRRWFDLDEYYLWHYCNGSTFFAIKSDCNNQDDNPPYLDIFESHLEAKKFITYYLDIGNINTELRIIDVMINPRPKNHRVGNRFIPCYGAPPTHKIEYRVFSDNNIRANISPNNLEEAFIGLKNLGEGYILICENDQIEGILEYGWLAVTYKW